MFFCGTSHRADRRLEQRHHITVVVDETHLRVERHVLVQVARSVVWLRAEYRAHLENALEDPDEHLLVELRTLREVRRLTEVIEAETVRAALGRGGDDLRREDFSETLLAQRHAIGGDGRVHEHERRATAWMAERDRGMGEDRRKRRIHQRPEQIEGKP